MLPLLDVLLGIRIKRTAGSIYSDIFVFFLTDQSGTATFEAENFDFESKILVFQKYQSTGFTTFKQFFLFLSILWIMICCWLDLHLNSFYDDAILVYIGCFEVSITGNQS